MAVIRAALLFRRSQAAKLAAIAAAMAAPAISAAEPRPGTVMTCTNLASGASWQIRIDYASGTVDSNPALITGAKIRWHDAADGGNYTLDRATGNLTAVVASSTGGFFLYHHCKLES